MSMTEEQPWTNIYDSEGLNFARLAWHCWVKGVQAGSVIGCAVVAPYTIFRGIRNRQAIDFRMIARRQVYSMAAFSVISLGMMMYKYVNWQNKAQCVQDRAYRIHYNKGQNRVDELSYICFLGSFVPMYLFSKRIIFSLGMTSPAIVGGMIFYQMTKQKQEKSE